MNPSEFDETSLREAKLTAYAMGELDGDEAAMLEREIDSDGSLRAEIDAIRRTAAALRAELSAEPALKLTDAQREALANPRLRPVDEGAEVTVIRRPWLFRPRGAWIGAGLAAAASLALVALLAPQFSTSQSELDQIARRNERLGEAPAIAIQDERLRDQLAAAANEYRFADDDKSVNRKIQLGQELLVLTPATTGQPAATLSASPSPASSPPMADGAGTKFANGSPQDAATESGALAAGKREADRQQPWQRGRTRDAAAPPASYPAPTSPPADFTNAPELDLDSTLRTPGSDGLTTEGLMAYPGDWPQLSLRGGFAGAPENYAPIVDNEFLRPTEAPLSTFSIDVDTASYANVRRFLNSGSLPPAGAVRIEEMINYFTYDYEPPSGDVPFSAGIEVNAAPWNPQHRLVRIGLKGKEIKTDMRPATSLVFLIDVSGSMNQPNKLPLVKQSLKALVDELIADDRLGIVTYAGNAGVLLESTYCTDENKKTIHARIESLGAGGATHGSQGIVTAYDLAKRNFIAGGVNRVILCTDGDFNVGVSNDADLVKLIEEQRKSNVFLSVLGFGVGNFQDAKMEQLSNHGNGNFAFIDCIEEARKVLIEQMTGTLITIAKDVKIQVEFNPAKVQSYRLIGYENRVLAAQDFNNDAKDAGEIGAGHTVTALYEVVPAGIDNQVAQAPPIDELKYQQAAAKEVVPSEELLTLKLRYKEPEGDVSKLLEFPVTDSGAGLEKASSDFQFAAAVAGFGMVLRDSPHKGNATFDLVLDVAAAGTGENPDVYRQQFVELVNRAKALKGG